MTWGPALPGWTKRRAAALRHRRGRARHRSLRAAGIACALVATASALSGCFGGAEPPPPPPPDTAPPPGPSPVGDLANFHDSVAFSGLTMPTVVQFASDGRVFVAEKSGVIKVFDDISDPTPTVFADLRNNVFDFWDRGLLGLALDPSFPTKPYVYVL